MKSDAQQRRDLGTVIICVLIIMVAITIMVFRITGESTQRTRIRCSNTEGSYC